MKFYTFVLKVAYMTTECCEKYVDLKKTSEGTKNAQSEELKVKFTLEQATKAQSGSICIAVLFLQPWR